jgi:hypothetical protein
MTRKTNIIVSSIFLLGFIISLFLPVLKFSFGIEINGIFAFIANFSSIILTESYLDYLKVMLTVISPVLLVVLIIWSYRNEIKLLPLVIVSIICLLGTFSWLFRYAEANVLMIGYYVWCILTIAVIIFNLLKIFKFKNE